MLSFNIRIIHGSKDGMPASLIQFGWLWYILVGGLIYLHFFT